MSRYEAANLEARPGIILDEAIDYELSEAQIEALPPEARIGLVIVSETMQRSFDSLETINEILATETGLDEDTLREARHALTGTRGNEGMRLDTSDGFRLLLTARGLESLSHTVEKVKKTPASSNGDAP